LLDQDWEGIIGETNNPSVTGDAKTLDRSSVLKHAADEAYKVNSPFSSTCVWDALVIVEGKKREKGFCSIGYI